MIASRRSFLSGIIAAAAAPAIIRTPGLIMPINPGLVGSGDGMDLNEESLETIMLEFDKIEAPRTLQVPKWYVQWAREYLNLTIADTDYVPYQGPRIA